MNANPKVLEYLEKSVKWQPELKKLREIFLSCDLDEGLKWGSPIYTYHGRNIGGMHGFKEHFAVWFHQGALLGDPHQVLIASNENTQALRQIRLASMKELLEVESVIRQYIFELIELEKRGVRFEFRKHGEPPIPSEFEAKLNSFPELKSAFDNLTPGRQREYLRYIAEPKQSATRESRVEKCIPLILSGAGLNDKYKC